MRIGEPFAEPVGRLKIYPDLAQQSYVQNINNDQYLYFLGIIGVGEYDIEDVYIENTPLTDYADSSYNILAPGDSPSLVPNIVWTCNEVSSQELSTDWVTYIVSSVGTSAYYLEYDVTFTGGLVGYNNDGSKYSVSVSVVAQARTVDSAGAALTSWTALDSKTFSGASKDPLRYSRKIAAPYGAGRYQVRVERTTETSESSRVMDKAVLSGLRAYGGAHPDYSDSSGLDLTMIECKIKASDQLNGDCGSQINVIGTRKLYPVTSTGFGATLSTTRNIADICAHIVTSSNGGRQDDAIIDFESLYELQQAWETDGYHFDYKFDSRTSVMDACATAGMCGQAVPYMPGGLFSLVRDELQALPACTFTRDNIEDLTIIAAPRTADSPTCVTITYINPDTWEEEEVICLDINGSEDNPSDITLDGCQDRQQAYEIGMYFYRQYRLERTTVNFVTGLMGHIPTLLSKIIVPNTMINWGQDGLIMAVGGTEIWLSEPVDFNKAETGAMYVSLPDGSSGGPYVVTPSDYAHMVYGPISVLEPLAENDLKATRYLFGPAEKDPMFVRVGCIQPQGKDKIKITGNLINDDIYDSPGTAPEIGSVVGSPDLLESISLSYVEQTSDGYAFLVSWVGSADSVLIQLSEDGGAYSTLEDTYTSHSLAFESTENDITVKVTPYDGSALQTADALTASKVVLLAPTGLSVTNDADGISAEWDAYTDAISYNLEVIVDGEVKLSTATSDTSTSVNSSVVAANNGPWDEVTVRLKAVTADGLSPGVSVTAAYQAPDVCVAGMLTSLAVLISGTSITLSWGGTSTQFDILVEQDGEDDITITQMTGSQRVITGLVVGDFTATVTPYASTGTLCTGQADSVTDTIV